MMQDQEAFAPSGADRKTHGPSAVHDALRVARRHLDKRDYQAALSIYSNLTRRFPNDVDVLFQVGEALQNTGRGRDAMQCYRRALRVQPKHYRALNNLGILLRRHGH